MLRLHFVEAGAYSISFIELVPQPQPERSNWINKLPINHSYHPQMHMRSSKPAKVWNRAHTLIVRVSRAADVTNYCSSSNLLISDCETVKVTVDQSERLAKLVCIEPNAVPYRFSCPSPSCSDLAFDTSDYCC